MTSQDSKHSYNSSWASNLPHLWVIEVLARSNQADVSLLLDLVKKTPEILENIGKNTREWVSLRILESFYDLGVRANSVSLTPTKRIGFDPSEQCEDVLRRILPGDMKTAALEILKWDFQPFIVHKRSSLVKCSLQKLKDAILTGSHPLSASLKEQSGLLGRNQSEDKVTVEESNNKDIATKPKGSNANTQISAANDQLNARDKNLLLSKRKRSSTVESDGGRQLTDTSMVIVQQSKVGRCTLGKKSHVVDPGKNSSFRDDNNEHTSLKRYPNPDEVLPFKEQVHNFVPDDTSEQDGRGLHLLANALSVILKNSEGDISCSGEKSNVGGMGTNSPSRVCCNNQTSTKDVIGLDEISRAHNCDTDMTNEALDEEHELYHAVKDSEGNKEGASVLKRSEKGMEPQQNVQRNACETEVGNMFCGSDVYYDDITNIARGENAILHSQFMHTQDSLEKVDWGELNRCIKCNKSGKLLICSSNSCSSAIHESCLGSDPIFEKMEEFHCPFCAYSLALSKYLEVKAKVSLARKDLAAFLSRGSRKQLKGKFCMSCGIVQNQLEQDDDSHKSEPQTTGKEVNEHSSRKKIERKEVGPSVLNSDDNPPRKGLASTSKLTKDLNKDKQGEGMGQESQSPKAHRQNQVAAMSNHISQGENTEVRSKKEVMCSSESDGESTSFPVDESADKDEVSGEGSEDSDFNKYFISIRKHKRRSSNPGTPQLRRKRVPWTIKEELTLKNGMERFCADQNKSIPWKKILDYGENVFHESRTTVDLKDKWRNVKKLLKKLYPSDEDAQVT